MSTTYEYYLLTVLNLLVVPPTMSDRLSDRYISIVYLSDYTPLAYIIGIKIQSGCSMR